MKPPKQRHRSTKDRAISPPPPEVLLSEVATSVQYTGSPYHKRIPSFAGPPSFRPDASICPNKLATRQDDIEQWLKRAVEAGHCGGDWKQGFPHHVWHREGEILYEGCLTNPGNGEYHGYPLEPDAVVRGLQ